MIQQSVKVSPILVIGMHRSGTSLLTKILMDLGIFMGEDLQEDQESLTFGKISQRIFYEVGANWDYPKSFYSDELSLKKDKFVEMVFKYFDKKTFKNYMGIKYYKKYGTPFNFDLKWGWKNPRNTFLIPIWWDVFKKAKVININRNGLDVSISLKERLEKAKEKNIVQRLYSYFIERIKKGYSNRNLKIHLMNFGRPQRVSTIEGGFSLWEEYMNEINMNVKNYFKDYFEIKYEDLLSNPITIIQQITEFCEVYYPREKIENISQHIDSSRAFRFKEHANSQTLYQKYRKRLEKYGYKINL